MAESDGVGISARRALPSPLALAILLIADAIGLLTLGLAFGPIFGWQKALAAVWLVANSLAVYFAAIEITRRDLQRAARALTGRRGLTGEGRWFDAEAEITFLPSDAGGRRTPARSGHLCTIAYDNRLRSADLWFGDDGTAAPGETVTARIRFTSPMRPENAIALGTTFEVREGRQAVAHGRIIRLLDGVEVTT